MRRYINEKEPKAAAEALVAKLRENPAVLGKKIIAKDDSEFLIEFIIQQDEPMYLEQKFEFNIFRFVKRNNILLSYQFAYAARGNLEEQFIYDFGALENYNPKRIEWINMMAKVEWDIPKLETK